MRHEAENMVALEWSYIGTSVVILLFLLILWYYLEARTDGYDKDGKGRSVNIPYTAPFIV